MKFNLYYTKILDNIGLMEMIYFKALELGYQRVIWPNTPVFMGPYDPFPNDVEILILKKKGHYLVFDTDGSTYISDEPPVGAPVGKITYEFFEADKPEELVKIEMPKSHWEAIALKYANNESVALSVEQIKKWSPTFS